MIFVSFAAEWNPDKVPIFRMTIVDAVESAFSLPFECRVYRRHEIRPKTFRCNWEPITGRDPLKILSLRPLTNKSLITKHQFYTQSVLVNAVNTLPIPVLTKIDDIHVTKISPDLKLIISFSPLKKIEIINPSGRM